MNRADVELRDRILEAEDPVDVVMLLFEHVQRRIAERGVSSLTATELVVLCMWDLVSEVNNGGFDQFFFNSSGDRSHETLAALRAIGATKTAADFDGMLRRLGEKGTSSDRATRIEALRAINPDCTAFERENMAFYPDPEGLWTLTAEYCRSHRDELRVCA